MGKRSSLVNFTKNQRGYEFKRTKKTKKGWVFDPADDQTKIPNLRFRLRDRNLRNGSHEHYSQQKTEKILKPWLESMWLDVCPIPRPMNRPRLMKQSRLSLSCDP